MGYNNIKVTGERVRVKCKPAGMGEESERGKSECTRVRRQHVIQRTGCEKSGGGDGGNLGGQGYFVSRHVATPPPFEQHTNTIWIEAGQARRSSVGRTAAAAARLHRQTDTRTARRRSQ